MSRIRRLDLALRVKVTVAAGDEMKIGELAARAGVTTSWSGTTRRWASSFLPGLPGHLPAFRSWEAILDT